MTRLLKTTAALVIGMVAVVASSPGYADARLAQSQGWSGDSTYSDDDNVRRHNVDPVDQGPGQPPRFVSESYQTDGYNSEGYIDAEGRWLDLHSDVYRQDFRHGETGTRAGSVDPDAWSPSSGSPGWRVDGRSDARNATPPAPAYRFRGDPPSGSAGWTGRASDGGYQFRPLNERESERRVQERGWRPLEPKSGSPAVRPPGQGGLIDALTPPPRIYGFEPNPWP